MFWNGDESYSRSLWAAHAGRSVLAPSESTSGMHWLSFPALGMHGLSHDIACISQPPGTQGHPDTLQPLYSLLQLWLAAVALSSLCTCTKVHNLFLIFSLHNKALTRSIKKKVLYYRVSDPAFYPSILHWYILLPECPSRISNRGRLSNRNCPTETTFFFETHFCEG